MDMDGVEQRQDGYGDYSLLRREGAPERPRISVLMSAFNSGSCVGRAVESILSQSFREFEFIIVEDGSSDNTREILRSLQGKDRRICLVEQENLGLTKSLNRALSLARGSLIARQDADDASLPERFARQLEFLDGNPCVGVCACSVLICDGDGLPCYSLKYNMDDGAIKRTFRKVESPLTHGSVMLRKELFDGLSAPFRFRYGQDFDLWLRLIDRTSFAILPEILYEYRRSKTSIGATALERRRKLETLMMRLLDEREREGNEKSDWAEEEQRILSASASGSAKTVSDPEPLMKLLSGRRFEAARKAVSNKASANSLAILALCALPFGPRLARSIHRRRFKGGVEISYFD